MRRKLLVFPFFCLLCVFCALRGDSRKHLDPGAWGSDHVGKPVPEYVTGGECLFCHRDNVGPGWAKNRHNLTIRDAGAQAPPLASLKASRELQEHAAEVRLLLGGNNRIRFLKPAAEYGRLDLLAVEYVPARQSEKAKLLNVEHPHWDKKTFADGCAGCHATGVDAKARTFSSASLDCYACHGEATLDHSKDSKLIYLAKKRKDPARVVTSICAQCHVRTGTSRSTGLPYANNFVAGDNLFRDFQADFSPEALAKLNPADRHVLENVRDVVLLGKEETTCLSCHDVHKSSAKKHHSMAVNDTCLNCHNATGSKKVVKKYEVHSKACGY